MPLVYDELRRLAQSLSAARAQRPYLAEYGPGARGLFAAGRGRTLPQWQNRAHFFGIAARVMRQILVEYARGHSAAKRGGASACKLTLDEALNWHREPTWMSSPSTTRSGPAQRTGPPAEPHRGTAFLHRTDHRRYLRSDGHLARHGEAGLDLGPGLAASRDCPERTLDDPGPMVSNDDSGALAAGLMIRPGSDSALGSVRPTSTRLVRTIRILRREVESLLIVAPRGRNRIPEHSGRRTSSKAGWLALQAASDAGSAPTTSSKRSAAAVWARCIAPAGPMVSTKKKWPSS